MIQNMYYRPKVLSQSEVSNPDRYKKDRNLQLKDYFIYQRSVSRKDVTGKKISDINYNIHGGGHMENLRRRMKDVKPDLLKSLFFRNSMSIKNCNTEQF